MNLDELAGIILGKANGRDRLIVAIAGPPGSGKSTLAQKLHDKIEAHNSAGTSVIVPMDGFHLDNETLDRLGLRQRKGAPETFDAEGFLAMMRQIKENRNAIAVPNFDREIDSTVDRGSKVVPEDKIVLAEGNYLLLETEPWNQLGDVFDYAIFVNPGMETLETRLVQRWLDHGHDAESARQRAFSNDIPNAETVIKGSRKPNLIIKEEL